MKRVKTRTDSGVVCEMKVFNVSERTDVKNAKPPRPRFKNDAEREAHRVAMSRKLNVQLVNANFSPSSLYSTLTFDDENEPLTFKEARHIRDNFIARLKYHAPEARIMIYMGRGKHTHRIHAHMLSEGVSEDLIIKLWGMGDIRRVEHLRAHNYYNGIDHGPDYTGLANYLFNHWTPEQGGRRRWKQTANLLRPDTKKPKVIKREYTLKKPPHTPKGYILVESRASEYGYLYFKYVRKPESQKRWQSKPQRKEAGETGL